MLALPTVKPNSYLVGSLGPTTTCLCPVTCVKPAGWGWFQRERLRYDRARIPRTKSKPFFALLLDERLLCSKSGSFFF